MTTFAELEALVVSQTRRPEIPAITQAAIRTAVLRAHHTDFFPRDLATGALEYVVSTAASYFDLANIQTLLPRLRSLQLLQSTDATTGAPVEELEYREISDLYEADGTLRQHIYTRIGETLRVYPALRTGKMLAYYYQNPVTASTGFNSWIANEHPDEVAMWAAGIVFARTGFMEMANDFQRTHVMPFKELLLSSYLLTTVN